SGGAPFHDVLIIGAGSGNDIAHALRFGANQIDAVEIDPVIQDIGRHYHPDHPYQDPRVIPHLDDGRHFLRTTDRKYDLVIYALVDSLILHSGYANIRLESYLFTQQAFADVKRVLKPEGAFVMYNYFRQGWIVERIAPTLLIHDGGEVVSTGDDWPFLYLRGRLIPDLTIRSMVILGLLGVGMVYLFLPKGRIAINGRMFFLGAAFMLLETRAVVQI